MSKLTLFYDSYCSWEKDYIQELFGNISYDMICIELRKLNNKLENIDEIINNNILVFSSNINSFDKIQNIVLQIKPIIIVHLSDEWGNKPEFTHLASHTKLLLHQYHFNHYPYHNYTNIIQMPLGYMTDMFNKENAFNCKVKPILGRKYKWSFVGNIKQDRQELIDKFSKKIGENFVGNNISSSNMFDIYNDSIFVPNGRGNVGIDCFRIYEAILSGSIPIIVCKETDFNERFYYNNDIPPFIFEDTWDNAVNKCEYLLNNVEELEKISQKNYEWLQKKFKSMQDAIYQVVQTGALLS